MRLRWARDRWLGASDYITYSLMRSLPRRDRVTLAVLGFFFVVATTVELYFLIAHDHLPAGASSNFIARMFPPLLARRSRLLRAGVAAGGGARGVERVRDAAARPAARLRHRAAARGYPLQLALGSYLAYSVVLYFVEQVSGYVNMAARTPTTLALFFGANAPWLIGYGWLALDAARVGGGALWRVARGGARLASRQRQRSNSGIGLRPSSEQLRQ